MHPKPLSVFPLLLFASTMFTLGGPNTASVSAQVGQEVQPGADQVIVVLTCSEQQGGGVRVNPYRRAVNGDETVTWRRVGSYQGEYAIEPIGFFPWVLSNGGVSNADGEITGTPQEGGAPDGVFSYAVRFTCNGDEVVLDPRMEVPR